jgi:hypothetical protein
MSFNNKDLELSDLFDELLGDIKKQKEKPKKKESSIPYEVFCFPEELGSEAWLYDTVSRTMIRAHNHAEVVRVTDPDKDDKILVRYAGTFVKVPSNYVCDIGFN